MRDLGFLVYFQPLIRGPLSIRNLSDNLRILICELCNLDTTVKALFTLTSASPGPIRCCALEILTHGNIKALGLRDTIRVVDPEEKEVTKVDDRWERFGIFTSLSISMSSSSTPHPLLVQSLASKANIGIS